MGTVLFFLGFLILVVVTEAGKSIYRRYQDQSSFILDNPNFFYRYILRPLYRYGQDYAGQGEESGYQPPPSILPPRLPGSMIPAKKQPEVPTGAKFAIQQTSSAHRCEVCHQSDCFDTGTGQCHRCQHQTI
jgi:hypothetical protein